MMNYIFKQNINLKLKQSLKKSLPYFYLLYNHYKNNRMLKNFFNTSFSKNVLICYITQPFYNGATLNHTNTVESFKIAESFKDIGYNCDIVNNGTNMKINYHKYDVVFGFGKAFENSLNIDKKILRIYYGTGKHPYFSNIETIKRGLDVKSRKGKFILESLRLIKEDYLLQTTAPNALIIVGGETESLTYRKYSNLPIYNINVSFFQIHNYIEIIKDKDFSEAKKHFLFFSGGGLIHKGLDLLVEVFSKQNDFHLHICAPVNSEPIFKKMYEKELCKNEYIHTYDFIDLNSDVFKKLIIKCAFVILPSCSEAMPTSVVNVVGNGGLIPILPSAASINVDELTILIQELSVESIIESINQTQMLTETELKDKSEIIGEFVNKNYTIENYSENIKTILQEIIHENKM